MLNMRSERICSKGGGRRGMRCLYRTQSQVSIQEKARFPPENSNPTEKRMPPSRRFGRPWMMGRGTANSERRLRVRFRERDMVAEAAMGRANRAAW